MKSVNIKQILEISLKQEPTMNLNWMLKEKNYKKPNSKRIKFNNNNLKMREDSRNKQMI